MNGEVICAKVKARRLAILNLLTSSNEQLSGTALSERFGVSRQIIVQDIAALKASGAEIISTRYGYLIRKNPFVERAFKIFHSREQTEDELTTIVSLGGVIADVFVWHRVYGKISAPLNITSKTHINEFLEGVRSGKSTELMSVTGGYHYHTVRADSEATLDRIEAALTEKGYIVTEM